MGIKQTAWPEVLAQLQTKSATLVRQSPFNPGYRAYCTEDRLFKICLYADLDPTDTRVLGLSGEHELLEACDDLPGIARTLGFVRHSHFEAIVLRRFRGMTLEQVDADFYVTSAALVRLAFCVASIVVEAYQPQRHLLDKRARSPRRSLPRGLRSGDASRSAPVHDAKLPGRSV